MTDIDNAMKKVGLRYGHPFNRRHLLDFLRVAQEQDEALLRQALLILRNSYCPDADAISDCIEAIEERLGC